MIISIIVYLAFGFLFMNTCAKVGWMDDYDPALFYWICWPVVILFAVFRAITAVIDFLNKTLQTYVDSLKPKQNNNQ